MARIRSVKPEFWNDRKLSRLSRDARLLYIALWNVSDEHGRLHGDARYIKGHCFPYDDDLGLDEVEALLDELAEAGRVERYDHDGDPYLYLPTLAKHQRLESAKQESRLPQPPSADNPAPEPEPSAHLSAESADSSEEIVAQHVAGSREHVAGSREHVAGPRTPPAGARSPASFEDFWKAYPRHVGKQDALKAWKSAVKSTTAQRIIEGAEAYRLDPNRLDEFTKHPATWLRAGCWDDDPLPPRLNGKAVSNGVASQPDEAYLQGGMFSRSSA